MDEEKKAGKHLSLSKEADIFKASHELFCTVESYSLFLISRDYTQWDLSTDPDNNE